MAFCPLLLTANPKAQLRYFNKYIPPVNRFYRVLRIAYCVVLPAGWFCRKGAKAIHQGNK